MKFFRRQKPAPVAPATEAPVVAVPVELMRMAYDRSAGRWCAHCGENGSHHTDRHNEFATYALEEFAANRLSWSVVLPSQAVAQAAALLDSSAPAKA